MDWLIKLFPDGWVIEPGMKIYAIVKTIHRRIAELTEWIEEAKYLVPSKDTPILKRWENLIQIQHIESGQQRVENIKNTLVGEYGLFNYKVMKKIIELYSPEKAEFTLTNGEPFKAGVAVAGDRLVGENGIFDVYLNIKNHLGERKKEFEETLQKNKHAHINFHIEYTGETT